MLNVDRVAKQTRYIVGVAQRVDIGDGEGPQVVHRWYHAGGTRKAAGWEPDTQRRESSFLAETLPDDRKHLSIQIPATLISTLKFVPLECRSRVQLT